MIVLCRHCGDRMARRPRRLCAPCYRDTGIRALYPADPRYSAHARGPEFADTREAVDAMVAAQMRCLPAWWHTEMEARP